MRPEEEYPPMQATEAVSPWLREETLRSQPSHESPPYILPLDHALQVPCHKQPPEPVAFPPDTTLPFVPDSPQHHLKKYSPNNQNCSHHLRHENLIPAAYTEGSSPKQKVAGLLFPHHRHNRISDIHIS